MFGCLFPFTCQAAFFYNVLSKSSFPVAIVLRLLKYNSISPSTKTTGILRSFKGLVVIKLLYEESRKVNFIEVFVKYFFYFHIKALIMHLTLFGNV